MEIREIKSFASRVRFYGIAYLLSANYRRLVQYEKNRKKGDKNKAKYGSGFLSSVSIVKGKLILRYGPKCAMCKRSFRPPDLSVDHIVRVADGGTHEMTNLRLLCYPCHKDVTARQNRMDNNPSRKEYIKLGLLKPLK